MRKQSATEEDLSERYSTRAQEHARSADNQRLAAAALRYLVDTGDEQSLAFIAQDAGVEDLSLDHLVEAAASVDTMAEREQSSSDAYNDRNSILLEHGLTTKF